MKRILGACLIVASALLLFGALAFAATPMAHHAAAAAAAKTVSGEIVDLSCYLGHGAKGAAHKECAATCIANGGPMGLLTDKGVLYVLTMNHENPDAFNAAKKHAGDMVKVTGAIAMKSATRALEVNAVEAI
ncbi:MAG TPA: hypothetical protein VEU09_00755 [Candidatus Binatia bacterium]|nr:hypothetical protein [Candidatus Binatia bacterium]